MQNMIDIERLSVYYNSDAALQDVTMQIGAGEFVAILGPNGSGKTTLLKAILGLVPCASGTIRLFGGPISGTGRKRMGYVPQKGNIDPTFPIKVFDAVMMGRYPSIGYFRFPSKRDREMVEESLKAVDMWHHRERPIGELSGGETQRVWIARALVSRPEALLLDEPTTGLDVKSQGQLIELIHRINRERGIAVLYVTHDVNNVYCHLHKVAYLKNRLFAFGPPRDVINVETLRKVYTGEVEVFEEDGRPVVIVGDHCHV